MDSTLGCKPHSRYNRTPGLAQLSTSGRENSKQCLFCFRSHWPSQFAFPHFSEFLNPLLCVTLWRPPKPWCVKGSKTSKNLAGRSSGHHASSKDAPSTVSKVTWWELGTNGSQMRKLRLHPGKGMQRIQEIGGGATGPGFFIFMATAAKTFTEREETGREPSLKKLNLKDKNWVECWETETRWRSRVRNKDKRGWDGWRASPTRWTWVWASAERWWWTGKPHVLLSMGSQRVRHDQGTELNQTDDRR